MGSSYSVKIGADAVSFLVDVLNEQGIADHVLSEEDTIAAGFDTDTIVFDNRVMQFLRERSPDLDGVRQRAQGDVLRRLRARD